MSHAVIDFIAPRIAGVIYTKPWMVELILDLAGYLPERSLARLVALEPSAGDGAFLQAMVRRLVESCRRHGTPFEQATLAIGAFEVDPEAAEKAIDVVYSTLIDRVRMRGGFLRFQAQYLRRIRVPAPESISPKLAQTLRQAFDTQDLALATDAALEAYQIESLPR